MQEYDWADCCECDSANTANSVNTTAIIETDTNSRDFYGENNVEFEWVGTTPLYEGSTTYPLVWFPPVLSKDVYLTEICSGGYLRWSDSIPYCGFQFKMSDGRYFPTTEWSESYESNPECVDLSNV